MTQKILAKINKSVEERLPYTRKYDFYVDEYIGREECGKTVRLFNQQSLLSETLNEIFKKVSKLLSRQTILEARMNQWAEGINVLISGMILSFAWHYGIEACNFCWKYMSLCGMHYQFFRGIFKNGTSRYHY